ncbi:MAG: Ig-like domain-containing protein, partial [Bacteroidales bacterium]|nr:Ig-like domain-containing protein [Bacteroidales bacterium]
MIRNHFKSLKTVLMATVLFLLSACNGDKLDPDLVDSIVGRISVSQVIIDQDDFEMTVGESATLTAVVLPDDATDKTLVWSSSKEDVLMVSSAGKAMALSPGKAVVTAKAGNKTDFITITVVDNAVRVTGVSLDKTSIALKVGESETLTATVAPADATNKNIIWTSSDEAVATVENGVVTGVSVGGATITVRTEDGNKTAECTVAVRTSLDPSVTTGSDHVSAIGAVLKGKANLDNTIPSDLEVGVLYSTSEGVIASNSTRVKAVNMDANFNYSVTVSPLEPATTYYFRSYVTRNGQDTYGATMSFTTKALSSMIHTDDASGISAVSAVLNGGFDLTDVPYSEKSFGFRYGTSSSSLTETKVASKNESTGTLWASLSALSPSTRYYYQAYVILDGKEYKESV